MRRLARALAICALAAVLAAFGILVEARSPASGAIAQEVPLGQDPRNLTVGIYYKDSQAVGRICTGIFIANGLLLTAGHCACAATETYIISLKRKMPLRVYERSNAKTVLKNDRDSLGLKRAPILFDPPQCVRGRSPGSDLALLVVDLDGVICGENGAPPCATNFREPVWSLLKTTRAGVSATVIGLGQTETNVRGEKRIVDIPILSLVCYPENYNQECAPFKEMIISGPGNRDSCGGDSGGPVFLRRDNKFLLIAITSRGAPGLVAGAGECGGGGIYTLLGRRSVLAWIDENLKQYARAN